MHYDWCPYKGNEKTWDAYKQTKGYMKTQWESSHKQTKERGLGRKPICQNLDLDLQPHSSICNILFTHTHTHTHIHTHTHTYIRTYRLPRWLSGKKSTWQAGEVGLIPGLGRWPGDGNGKPKYSCLGNPMDRGAWWAIVLGVPKELDMT